MDVEDEVVGAAVGVGDAGEDGGGAARDKGRGARVAVACRVVRSVSLIGERGKSATYRGEGSSGS